MYFSIDFGGSTIDVVEWKENLKKSSRAKIFRTPQALRTFEREKVFAHHDLGSFLKTIRLPLNAVEKIFVTGGRSRFFQKQIRGIPLQKVSEIEAIGRGGYFLLHHDRTLKRFLKTPKVLVVSMGTGTCMVELQQPGGIYVQSKHVGGTGVGGGTFLGLTQALLQETDIQKLKALFRRGDKGKVDLSVYDIIGSGIGLVPPTATASNLAKLSREIHFSKSDLTAGIVNLIGQIIGIIAVFAAQARGCELIVLTGKLTRMEKILDRALEVGKIYKIPMVIPAQAAVVGALGAGGIFQEI